MARLRVRNACETCRKRKIKCSGGRPCESCAKQNRNCSAGETGRDKYSQTYVDRLRSRLRTYERRSSQASSDRDTGHGLPPVAQDGRNKSDHPSESVLSGADDYNDLSTQGQQLSPVALPQNTPSSVFRCENQETPPNDVDLASGPALEYHLRSLVADHSESRPGMRRANRRSTQDPGASRSNSGPEWITSEGLLQGVPQPEPPPVQEGLRLYRLFMTYMGVTQHFLDDRAFTDSLTVFSRSPSSRMQLMQTLWYRQYLLVLAMGKLLDDDPGESSPPGLAYFARAMHQLPSLHELGVAGSVTVEVLALAATYLQWIGKKRDAYLYVGSGLRLAIVLGYAQPQSEFQCLPSEAAHRVRLFWTLYMLDRRLASSLGLSVGVNNKQVRANLPWHSPGFESPTPMCINIKLAYTTGEIMCSLYRDTCVTRAEYIKTIESIMKDLRDVPTMIPDEHKIDFEMPALRVTRTGASLYLMLYQAILLCLRPIILHKVRTKVNLRARNTSETEGETFERLLGMCRDAASKSISLLSALRKQNLLARFGFFDLDAAFSAAFILVMTSIIEGSRDNSLPSEIKSACDVLRFLTDAGNNSAKERLKDIARFCASIWRIDEDELVGGRGIDYTRRTNGLRPNPEVHYASTAEETEFHAPESGTSLRAAPGSPPIPLWNESVNQGTALNLDQADASALDLDFNFTNEAECIYSGFNDSTVPLSGVDIDDWLEMERMVGEYTGG